VCIRWMAAIFGEVSRRCCGGRAGHGRDTTACPDPTATPALVRVWLDIRCYPSITPRTKIENARRRRTESGSPIDHSDHSIRYRARPRSEISTGLFHNGARSIGDSRLRKFSPCPIYVMPGVWIFCGTGLTCVSHRIWGTVPIAKPGQYECSRLIRAFAVASPGRTSGA
jgi:hypothetical protein